MKKSEKENRIPMEEIEPSGEYTVKHSRLLDNIARAVTLILAFILWVYVAYSSNESFRTTMDLMPIEVQGAAELAKAGYTMKSISYDRVNLTLSGTRTDINKVNPDNVKVYIDLSELSPENMAENDKHTLPLHVDLPSGVALAEVLDNVQVTMEKMITVVYPVNRRNLAVDSFMLDESCTIDPERSSLNTDFVVISAPQSVVEKIKSISFVTTTTVTVTSTSTVTVKMNFLDKHGLPLTVDSESFSAVCYQGGRLNEDGTLQGGYRLNTVTASVALNKTKCVPLTIRDEDGYLSGDMIRIDPVHVWILGDPATVDALQEISMGTFSAKKLSSEQGGWISMPVTLETWPEGLYSIALPNGAILTEEKLTAQVLVYAGKTYRLHVPGRYVSLLGGSAQLVNDGFDLELRTVGDDTFFLLLEENIRLGKEDPGITLVVNLTDINTATQTVAPLTVVFSPEFRGRIYEVYPGGVPYTATIRASE